MADQPQQIAPSASPEWTGRDTIDRPSSMALAEYQERFKRQFALAVEGMCPRGCGQLAVHEHGGRSWACCATCSTAWQAYTNTEPDHPKFEVGEHLLRCTGTLLWH